MIDLITLDLAKSQVYEVTNQKDTDIAFKIMQASAIVAKYCKLTDPPDVWAVSGTSPVEYEVPFDIQCATVLVLGELCANREASTADPLTPAVLRLLVGYRDPTLA